MLAELDKDAAVLLKNMQCPQGASFMASFDESILLVYIIDLVLMTEGFAVTAVVSTPTVNLYTYFFHAVVYSLINTDNKCRGNSACPLDSFVALLDVVGKGQDRCCGRTTACRVQDRPAASRRAWRWWWGRNRTAACFCFACCGGESEARAVAVALAVQLAPAALGTGPALRRGSCASSLSTESVHNGRHGRRPHKWTPHRDCEM